MIESWILIATIFKANSVSGAACSKAAGSGVTAKQILQTADWSSEGTFQQFYHRRLENEDKTSLSRHILSSESASNNAC